MGTTCSWWTQLMNLFPCETSLLCPCHVHTPWEFDRCLWNKGRKAGGREGRRKEGRKKGRQVSKKQAGKEKKWHIYIENSAWWARTLLLNLLFLIAGGDQFEASRSRLQRECSQQKKANFSSLSKSLNVKQHSGLWISLGCEYQVILIK